MKSKKYKLSAILFYSVIIALALGLPNMAFATPVPDTGQTKCYNNTVEIPCPQPGEPFYGQDAQYTTSYPHSYTKLGSNGAELPEDATSWLMVQDNLTGLVWEVKHNKDSVKNYADPNDADNTYTWYDGEPGTPGNGTDTQDFIIDLNAQNYGGYNDWRLPTAKELAFIKDSSRYNPAIDTAFFPNTQADDYWSSTIFVVDSSYSFRVSFLYEDVDATKKQLESKFVRAVHGPQSVYGSHLVDNGNGTVTDTDTGLMWQKATAPGTYTWEQALQYCESLNLAGYTDWRLPSKNELYTIVDNSRAYPSINLTYFPDTQSNQYITSTTATDYNYDFWGVDFSRG
jgi:hypothetical protein